jgi:hypothetical protein
VEVDNTTKANISSCAGHNESGSIGRMTSDYEVVLFGPLSELGASGYFLFIVMENTVLRVIAMLCIAASVSSCAVAPGYEDGYAKPYDFVYGYPHEYPYGPVYAPAYGTVNFWGGWGGYHHWHGYEHWHGGGHGGHGGGHGGRR